MQKRPTLPTLFLFCLLLAACGSDKNATSSSSNADESLPKPETAAGSVTGMPNPGTPSALPAPADNLAIGNENPDIATEDTPALDSELSTLASSDAAVLVLREYYAAINARDYGKAYAQWSGGGRASGQSPQQFADGYATTQGVSVVLGEPGPIEGAAGSRYVQIPATLDATQADGSIRHYTGTFTLRMTMVDGASEAQRSWHIASADLLEARR